MAKKRLESTAPPPRARRSPDQRIAELQARIRAIEQRAAAKALKRSPSARATLQIVRKLDKAMNLAAEEGATALRHVLSDARKPVASFLEAQGVKLPKPRTPRGRRPKLLRN
jgi:hypothetical protein